MPIKIKSMNCHILICLYVVLTALPNVQRFKYEDIPWHGLSNGSTGYPAPLSVPSTIWAFITIVWFFCTNRESDDKCTGNDRCLIVKPPWESNQAQWS